MLKIYGADLSSPANKVRFVANYLDLEYEYIRVKIKEGEHQSKEFLNINPVGKIPAIDDDGFCLFESNAICRYLADKNNSNIYPKNLNERAVVDQWIDFAAIHIQGAVGRILFNKVFARVIGEEVDEKSLECGEKFLARFLPVANEQLKKKKHIACDKITLADFVLLSALDPTEIIEKDVSTYPAIQKWRKELQQRPFYTKCHKSYGEAVQRMMAGK